MSSVLASQPALRSPALGNPCVLAFDTSTEVLAVALAVGQRQYAVQVAGGAQASAQLLPQVHRLLQQAGCTLDALDAIGFGQGPGAFTGLRTACSVAQGLGLGLGLPLLPIDSLLIVAEAARAQRQPGAGLWQIAVAMDARMNEVYAARYAWQGSRWQTLQAPGLHSLTDLSEDWAQQRADAAGGSALPAFGERLLWPTGVEQRFADEAGRASALLRLTLQAYAQGQGVDAADALPLYLRDKVAQTTAERQAQQAQQALTLEAAK